MPIEIRELVIQAKLAEEAEQKDSEDKASSQDDCSIRDEVDENLAKMRQGILDECKHMIRELMNRQER
jgi:hypothetical protein